MNKILREKINESLMSVLPITVIVLLLSVTVAPMPVGTLAISETAGLKTPGQGIVFSLPVSQAIGLS